MIIYVLCFGSVAATVLVGHSDKQRRWVLVAGLDDRVEDSGRIRYGLVTPNPSLGYCPEYLFERIVPNRFVIF